MKKLMIVTCAAAICGGVWAADEVKPVPTETANAKSTEQEAQYIRNRGFDDQHNRDLIVGFITKFGMANRKQIRELLWDKLPEVLTDRQKEVKITSLLSSLRDKRVIRTDSSNQQKSHWILVDPNRDAN